ncbi:hypothetical protein HYPSUDRAFT_210051 [Hypholoma sublateritium FD-334 SS-4]|uniref:Uncharacterized protein n=1 Tax=Hypholoma sublateritium (strain FD-334 SS-4) TaxID=945553 RepID=A0A0D2N0X7_HYPSF|nr:hypothetical protein HYPSUDRAFT_210051 [Hypholoma sublateritium FD-334 SS-4]
MAVGQLPKSLGNCPYETSCYWCLGRLPYPGRSCARRIALSLIGAYSSWFSTHAHEDALNPSAPDLLLTVLTYMVLALMDPALSLSVATALHNLCEVNRKALAVHIGAFRELHTAVVFADPMLGHLYRWSHRMQLPDEARASTVFQLKTLAGVAKGLTRSSNSLSGLEDNWDPNSQHESEIVKLAWQDPRSTKLCENIFSATRAVVDMWPADAAISLVHSVVYLGGL